MVLMTTGVVKSLIRADGEKSFGGVYEEGGETQLVKLNT
jgi:hypothetical protein